MAELTAPGVTTGDEHARVDDADGHEPALVAQAGVVDADPRAVRVRLAAASAEGDEPTIRVSPPVAPLRMTNPTTGRGPLGGASIPAATDASGTATEDDGAVRAQRRPLVDGEPVDLSLRPLGRGRFVLGQGGERRRVILEAARAGAGGVRRREVIVDGFRFEVEVESERIAALRERATRGRASSAHSGPLEVRAIIPGKVASVSVAEGDAVTAGQQLLVVEAMKMQNELRSPRDGTIERVGVAPGVNIEVGDLLVVLS